MFIWYIQEPITRSLHMCCTLESTLSDEELFLEQALPRKYIVSENVRILHASAIVVKGFFRARKSVCKWALLSCALIGYYGQRIRAWQIFRGKACSKNNSSSERVDSKGLYGRWRLRVIGSWYILLLFKHQSNNYPLYAIWNFGK